MTTTLLYIRWKDDNGNQSGHFYGSHDGDQWAELDSFPINDNHTYDFVFSSDSGGSYTAYLTLQSSDGVNVAVKGTDGSEVIVREVDVYTQPITARASRLVSDDPRAAVTWSNGSGNSSCALTWNGSQGWTNDDDSSWTCTQTIELNGSSGSVSIQITDASPDGRTAAVYEGVMSHGIINDFHDLTDAAPSHTFTLTRPGSAETTTYTVNLFDKMDHLGTMTPW